MWTIENAHVTLGVDEKTGQVRRLVITPPGGAAVDLFEQLRGDLRRSAGGVAVVDELTGQRFSDLVVDGFEIVDAHRDNATISITKRYHGAHFDVTTTYQLEGPQLVWRVRVNKHSGPDRSIQVFQFLPQLVGWNFWAPAGRTPFALDGMSSFEYFYVNGNGVGYYDIAVPLVAVYSPKVNAGLAIALPFDARIPAAKFQSINGPRVFAWGAHRKADIERMPYLEVVHYFIGLRGDKPLEVSCILSPTVGHWRPALGWAVGKWRSHFFPGSGHIHERQGIYYCGSPLHADCIDQLLRYNARFLELHAHFPHYGLYFPENDRPWRDIGQVEHGQRHVPVPLSVPELHRRIAKLADAGINVYYYFQLNDGYDCWSEERFPDSIAKNEDGSFQASGWRKCHNMNADLSFPWGQFQLTSARSIVEAYPQLAGFFLDCWRHYELDFAHDDGLTMVNSKPCYSVNFHYDDITRIIAEMLHARGMETFANKPHTIRSCADIDSVLMEGSGDDLERMMFYTALARPYYYLWTDSTLPTEEWLKRSLAFGAYPMAPRIPRPSDADPSVDRLYAAYLPLYELLRRRVLCCDPDPVSFPLGTWGQLYSLPGDLYVCVVVRDGFSCFDSLRSQRVPEVNLRLPRGVSSARIHYPGPEAAAGGPVQVGSGDHEVTVPLPEFRSAAVLILE